MTYERNRITLAIATLGAVFLLCSQSFAFKSDDDARILHKQGVELFESGDYIAAAEAFSKAYSLKPSWKLLHSIGQCEAAAKHYGKALTAFEKYLVEGGDDISEDRREEVLRELAKLRPLVGMIEINCKDGATVSIDGDEIGECPLSGPVRASATSHTVIVRSNEKIIFEKEIALPGQTTLTLNAYSSAADDSNEENPQVEDDPGISTSTDKKGPLFVSAIVTGALGVAAAGVGTVFVVKGKKDWDTYESAAADGNNAKYKELKDDTIPANNIGVAVGFGAAGALLATSVTLFIVDALKKEDNSGAVAVTAAPGGFKVVF